MIVAKRIVAVNIAVGTAACFIVPPHGNALFGQTFSGDGRAALFGHIHYLVAAIMAGAIIGVHCIDRRAAHGAAGK
jgi:hypothetical protein